MAGHALNINPPLTHNVFSAAVDVSRMEDKELQVTGTAGGHTCEIHGSEDGATFFILTGVGTAGAQGLPANGSIAADGLYAIPQDIAFVKTKKTDVDDAAQIVMLLQGRVRGGS